MALIKCPECGKEISSMGKSCPNCGCPIDNASNGKTILRKIADLLDISVKELFGVIGGQAIIVAVIILFFGGCDFTSDKHARNIRTADQWVTYCDSEPNIHRCLKAFDKIDLTTQCRIYDDIALMVANLTKYDEKGRIKADAYGYIWIYMVRYEKGKLLGEELKKTGIADKMNTNYATMILTERRFRELIDQWENE